VFLLPWCLSTNALLICIHNTSSRLSHYLILPSQLSYPSCYAVLGCFGWHLHNTMASTCSRKLSTLVLFDKSSLPRTLEEWKIALHQVKFLYIQRQYKQCASRAETLLGFSREPVSLDCSSVLVKRLTKLDPRNPQNLPLLLQRDLL
jgi:hypothetical protein